jgi:hypothetical protein
VRDFPEELERVALFLQRVGGVGLPEDLEFGGDDLPFLALALRLHELAAHLDGGAGVGPGDLGRVVGEGGIGDDLDALEAGAVVELEERERLRVAARADPALEQDGADGRRGVQCVFDEGT